MKINYIKFKLVEAVKQLEIRDFVLFKNNVSERAICHKLAVYLQLQFPNYDVDCEYNRNFELGKDEPKFIEVIERKLLMEIRRNHIDPLEIIKTEVSTYPDIIVHTRKINEDNTLVIEVKKLPANWLDREYDCEKLKGFTAPDQGYHYDLGVLIEYSINQDDKIIFNYSWFVDGNQVIIG